MAEYHRHCRWCGVDFETNSRSTHFCSDACRHSPERKRKACRGYWLKFMYGMTNTAYNHLLSSQNYQCAICYTDEPGGSGDRFHVDHCHETDVIRGLLCSSCNQALGLMQDNPGLLIQAAEYLGDE